MSTNSRHNQLLNLGFINPSISTSVNPLLLFLRFCCQLSKHLRKFTILRCWSIFVANHFPRSFLTYSVHPSRRFEYINTDCAIFLDSFLRVVTTHFTKILGQEAKLCFPHFVSMYRWGMTQIIIIIKMDHTCWTSFWSSVLPSPPLSASSLSIVFANQESG